MSNMLEPSDDIPSFNEDYFKSLSIAKIKVEPQNSLEYTSKWNKTSTIYTPDSDECEIVGIVKPLHLRTPEIVDLEINLTPQADTGHLSSNDKEDPTVEDNLFSNDKEDPTVEDNLFSNDKEDPTVEDNLFSNDAFLQDDLSLDDFDFSPQHDSSIQDNHNLDNINFSSHDGLLHDNHNFDNASPDDQLNPKDANYFHDASLSTNLLTDQQTSELSDTISNNTDPPELNKLPEKTDIPDNECEIILTSARVTDSLASFSSRQLRRELRKRTKNVIDLTLDNSFEHSNNNRQSRIIDLTKNKITICPEVIAIDD